MQLDLLLTSIEKNFPHFDSIQCLVVASDDKFNEAYTKLIHKWERDPRVKFTEETEFRRNTISLVDQNHEFTCLACDDNVIYRQAELPDMEQVFGPDVITFALRYGLNTLMQDHYKKIWQPPLRSYQQIGPVIKWNYKDYHPLHNYGYPFGLDMHIYRTSVLLKYMMCIDFENTNQLESGLFQFKGGPQSIISFPKSISVNVPLTNLSGVTQSDNITVEELNDAFLQGKRLHLEDVEMTNVIGAHQSIPLRYEQYV